MLRNSVNCQIVNTQLRLTQDVKFGVIVVLDIKTKDLSVSSIVHYAGSTVIKKCQKLNRKKKYRVCVYVFFQKRIMKVHLHVQSGLIKER